MNLGENLKNYRNKFSLSQEILAEKIYVSRQTISNWENEKTYPDINSLVLLSEVFGISIDELIKGDIETMKEIINSNDINKFNKSSSIFSILFLIMIISPVPLIYFFGKLGIIVWVLIAILGVYAATVVERQKKKFDIQSYKEIVAFTEGEKLDEIAKAKEEGKRPYQKLMLALFFALLTILMAVIFIMILK